MITLSENQLAGLMAEVKAELVAKLLSDRHEDLQLLSANQACGLMNVDVRTLTKLIPRVVIFPNNYRYRAADIAAFVAERTEQATK
ncbi:hypothetical protein HQ447_05530 [bacterium]|nr:hypothetical protein [bacterium]